ncbi:hypothetical protein Tco_1060988 [Tanacetum coccineum]
MDNPNITMKEYIRLQEEKALSRGETFNWQTATFEKVKYYEDEDDCFTDFETEFPAIVFDNTLTSDAALSYEPMVSPPNKNEIDFRISLDESNDEDYMMRQELFTSHAWRRLFEITEPLVREFILEFLSTCRMSDMEMGLDVADTSCFQLGGARRRGQAPEKVIGVDLFYLKSMDRGTANVPYLLALYLFRHAEGRKSGARLSRGHFIGCLAAHFGMVSDQGLRGLSVVTCEFLLIDLHKLGRLNICKRFGDIWTWVASGPERQPDDAASAPRIAEDAPIVDEGAQANPAPVQAPQPPLAAPRTMA